MATIKFYLRKSTTSNTAGIQCSVSWPGNRIQKSTGQTCLVKDWSESSSRIKPSGYHSNPINSLLDTIFSNLNTHFTNCRLGKSPILQEEIEEIISGKTAPSKSQIIEELIKEFSAASLSGDRRTSEGKKITAGTLKGYKNSFTCLMAYLTPKRITSIDQVTEKAIKGWQAWQWEDKPGKNKKGEDIVVPGYYDNYVGRNARVWNAFATWLENTGKSNKLPRAKAWKEDIDIVALEPDELKAMAQWSPADPIIVYTRDIFLLGCMTCLRVSDLLSLKSDNVVNSAGGWSLSVVVTKTTKSMQIKLNPFSKKIIEERMAQGNDFLFPDVSDQEFNRRLKDLSKAFALHLKEANIETANNWMGNFARTRYRAGEPFTDVVPMVDMVSSHTMRRTGITSLLIMGVPEILVKKVSGHSGTSKSFAKYVRFAQHFIDSTANSAWIKVFE
ncbi:MAG: tyrosine-type recombinase/integrase [Cytophagaceae bacterium]|nr:tyrosine-type recombinase/integrase [Cytophagaceae bacterium]